MLYQLTFFYGCNRQQKDLTQQFFIPTLTYGGSQFHCYKLPYAFTRDLGQYAFNVFN